ncbi:MAG: MFS transporter [Sphingobium sp.]
MGSATQYGRWYHGWNIVATCVMCTAFALALTMNCFSLFLPGWTKEFGVPVSSIALSITLFSLGTALLSVFIGICADRYPARWLFGGGLVVLAAAHLLVALSQAVWQIIAIYVVLMPVALGFTSSIPSQSLVSRWFARRVGLAMGLTAFGLAIAGVLCPPIIVQLLPIVGWRALWGGMAVLILVVGLPIAMLVLRDHPNADDPFGYVTPVQPGDGTMKAMALPLSAILRRRNFWVIIGAFSAVQFVAMTIAINITPIITSYGGSQLEAGLFLSIYSVSALASKLGSGWLADRIGNRIPLVLTTVGSASGALLLSLANTNPLFLAGTAVVAGFSAAIWTLLASSILAEFGPASFGKAFGLACAGSPIGTFAPPVVARVQELTGSYATALLVLGGLALLAALSVLLIYRVPAPRPVPRLGEPSPVSPG